jgi:hypothetical protein
MIARQITRLVEDINKRPADGSTRKLVVTLGLKPKTEQITNGPLTETVLIGIGATIKAKISIPDQETAAYDLGVKRDGRLVFNPHSPFNHRQRTFLGEDEDRNVIAGTVIRS